MLPLRLKTIASFIDKEDKVADIGCDHAYLAIYLAKSKKCQSVLASDIHENALKSAKKNIQSEHLEKEIPTILSDGLLNIPQEKMDTLVIAGMGTSTILHILERVEKKHIKKMILQSNHDLYALRKEVQKSGYYLQEEEVVYEKGHYYTIGKYTQEKRKLTKRELYFGLYDEKKKKYYHSLQEEYENIYPKIKYKNFKKKCSILYKMYMLKKYL